MTVLKLTSETQLETTYPSLVNFPTPVLEFTEGLYYKKCRIKNLAEQQLWFLENEFNKVAETKKLRSLLTDILRSDELVSLIHCDNKSIIPLVAMINNHDLSGSTKISQDLIDTPRRLYWLLNVEPSLKPSSFLALSSFYLTLDEVFSIFHLKASLPQNNLTNKQFVVRGTEPKYSLARMPFVFNFQDSSVYLDRNSKFRSIKCDWRF